MLKDVASLVAQLGWSIALRKRNPICWKIKTTVIIYECFVFIYYVRNSKLLKFWALASQWPHAHRVQPPKKNWNGTTILTVMNLRQLIPKGGLIFDCKSWRPLQHKRGVQVEKGAIMFNSLAIWTLSTFLFFSTISSKTRDLIQTDFNLRIEGKKIKIFNRSHYMKVLLLRYLVVYQ